MEALNFYNPLVADQLRSRRKTVTIRLGDKSAKYRKGLCLKVLCGQRFGPRTHVFDAVVDKVEVKRLGDVSPRELQHDNPELRTLDEFVVFLGPALQPRRLGRGHGDRDPLLRDPALRRGVEPLSRTAENAAAASPAH